MLAELRWEQGDVRNRNYRLVRLTNDKTEPKKLFSGSTGSVDSLIRAYYDRRVGPSRRRRERPKGDKSQRGVGHKKKK